MWRAPLGGWTLPSADCRRRRNAIRPVAALSRAVEEGTGTDMIAICSLLAEPSPS
jgi:hypothetical protein